jgi:hypothetical protein
MANEIAAVRTGATMAGHKQNDNGMIALPVTFLIIVGGIWYIIHQHYWGLLMIAVLFALTITALAYVIQVRTKCLVTFTATGLPCQNPTRGIIFGCNGQNHKWDKAFATIGLHRQGIGPHPAQGRTRASGQGGLGTAGNAGGVVTVRIEGNIKNTVTFYSTVLASIFTILVSVDQLRHYL